jgi:hypothetical protein
LFESKKKIQFQKHITFEIYSTSLDLQKGNSTLLLLLRAELSREEKNSKGKFILCVMIFILYWVVCLNYAHDSRGWVGRIFVSLSSNTWSRGWQINAELIRKVVSGEMILIEALTDDD